MRDQTPLPLRPPKPPSAPFLARGLIYLGLGVADEALAHPILPWAYAPGILFVDLGLGVALALFNRAQPRWGMMALIAVGVGVLAYDCLQGASLLSAFVYLSAFYLTRWLLALEISG